MYDKDLVLAVINQIDEALAKVVHRTVKIKSANDLPIHLKVWRNLTESACFLL
jgi:hypothetical protein